MSTISVERSKCSSYSGDAAVVDGIDEDVNLQGKQSVQEPCPEYGAGWTMQTIPRLRSDRVDNFWYSPDGMKFCSKKEAERYLSTRMKSDKKFKSVFYAKGDKVYASYWPQDVDRTSTTASWHLVPSRDTTPLKGEKTCTM